MAPEQCQHSHRVSGLARVDVAHQDAPDGPANSGWSRRVQNPLPTFSAFDFPCVHPLLGVWFGDRLEPAFKFSRPSASRSLVAMLGR